MSFILELHNQTKKKVDKPYFNEAARIALSEACVELGEKQKISVVFVGDDKMSEINEKYTGRKGVTDVLSFNLDTEEYLGEIFICPSQAENFQVLTQLFIHGILHLGGYDHEKKMDAKAMRDLEKKILSQVV